MARHPDATGGPITFQDWLTGKPQMLNERANAKRIALELIAEIALAWAERPDARCVQKNGFYVFEYVLSPFTQITRLFVSTAIDANLPDSTVQFNPFPEATEIVLAALEKTRALHAIGELNAKERDYIVRRDAKAEILTMLQVAQTLFKDAIWQAQLIGGATHAVENIIPSGRLDIARNITSSTLTAIENRLKKRIPKVSKSKKLKISESAIARALDKFFPAFKATGALPSQRQFAIAIGVTAKAWRTFLTKYDLDKHEVTIKQWYEYMLANDTHREGGDFLPPT